MNSIPKNSIGDWLSAVPRWQFAIDDNKGVVALHFDNHHCIIIAFLFKIIFRPRYCVRSWKKMWNATASACVAWQQHGASAFLSSPTAAFHALTSPLSQFSKKELCWRGREPRIGHFVSHIGRFYQDVLLGSSSAAAGALCSSTFSPRQFHRQLRRLFIFRKKRTLLKIQNAVCSALCFFIWDFPSGRFARFQLRCRRVLPSVAMSPHVSFMVVSSSITKIIGHFGKRNFVEQLTDNAFINSIIWLRYFVDLFCPLQVQRLCQVGRWEQRQTFE